MIFKKIALTRASCDELLRAVSWATGRTPKRGVHAPRTDDTTLFFGDRDRSVRVWRENGQMALRIEAATGALITPFQGLMGDTRAEILLA